MEVLDQGVNPMFMDPDPDKARESSARSRGPWSTSG
jgi:hypothetical protein